MRWPVVVLLCMPAMTSACEHTGEPPAGAVLVSSAQSRISFSTQPHPIPVAAPFSMDVWACRSGRGAQNLELDARMPAHGHGMNYRPAITQIADGHFRVDGLLFHMPGQWQLRIVAQFGTERETLVHDIGVK